MTDLDESWDWVYKWQAALPPSTSRSSEWAWGRLLSGRVNNFKIATKAPVSAVNYATMIASHLIAQPKHLQLDIRDAVARYVALRNAAAEGPTPWRSAPGERDTLFNMPIGSHTNGWGNIPGVYGFDEGFLKRVVYPHCVQRGQLVTFDYDGEKLATQGGGPTASPGENAYVTADLAYAQSFKGNQLVRMR